MKGEKLGHFVDVYGKVIAIGDLVVPRYFDFWGSLSLDIPLRCRVAFKLSADRPGKIGARRASFRFYFLCCV